MTDNAYQQLEKFGFTSYEAKVYLALLRKNPLNGYELAKRSGVPQSRVYEVLNRLEAEHYVTKVDCDTNRYTPMPYDLVLERLTAEFRANIGKLSEVFQKNAEGPPAEYGWVINDYKQLIQQAKVICEGARETLYISCWDEEYGEIEGWVEKAHQNGVKVLQIGYGERLFPYAVKVPHGVNKHVLERCDGGREFYVVADGGIMASAIINQAGVRGIWSRAYALVYTAQEYICHNAYFWSSLRAKPELFDIFGHGLEKLHDMVAFRLPIDELF